jgi:hypothetical protein
VEENCPCERASSTEVRSNPSQSANGGEQLSINGLFFRLLSFSSSSSSTQQIRRSKKERRGRRTLITLLLPPPITAKQQRGSGSNENEGRRKEHSRGEGIKRTLTLRMAPSASRSSAIHRDGHPMRFSVARPRPNANFVRGCRSNPTLPACSIEKSPPSMAHPKTGGGLPL